MGAGDSLDAYDPHGGPPGSGACANEEDAGGQGTASEAPAVPLHRGPARGEGGFPDETAPDVEDPKRQRPVADLRRRRQFQGDRRREGIGEGPQGRADRGFPRQPRGGTSRRQRADEQPAGVGSRETRGRAEEPIVAPLVGNLIANHGSAEERIGEDLGARRQDRARPLKLGGVDCGAGQVENAVCILLSLGRRGTRTNFSKYRPGTWNRRGRQRLAPSC